MNLHFFFTTICVLATVSHVTFAACCMEHGTCISGDTLCNHDQYCNGASCIDVDSSLVPVFTNDFSQISPSTFKMIMISDIQYNFYNCKEQEALCIYEGQFTEAENETALTQATNRVSQCVDNLTMNNPGVYQFLIDGGDLTNSGLDSELPLYTAFKNSLPAMPKGFVLGNHDYYVDAGVQPKNAARMIDFLHTTIDELKADTSGVSRLRSVDYNSAIVQDGNLVHVKFIEGSLMFSVDVNGILFIVMHWAPNVRDSAGNVWTGSFYVPPRNSPSGMPEYYTISRGFGWLKSQLSRADIQGKKVVLVPHSRKAFPKYMANHPDIVALFRKTGIAVLAGHDHDQWGKYGIYVTEDNGDGYFSQTLHENDIGLTTAESVPVYYAGSATYQKFITAEFTYTAGATDPWALNVIPYTTEAGSGFCTQTTDDNSD